MASRRSLQLLLLFGALGTGAELLLLEHFEDWKQTIPLAALGLVVAVGLAQLWLHAPERSNRLRSGLRILSWGLILCGIAGVVLHFKGNLEFERELAPTRSLVAIWWAALGGAFPALAPGFVSFLGLLGLLSTSTHSAD